MKIRDLVNALERIREADQDMLEADTAYRHGGCASTMQHKEQNVRDANQRLEDLLEEDV